MNNEKVYSILVELKNRVIEVGNNLNAQLTSKAVDELVALEYFISGLQAGLELDKEAPGDD